MSKTTLKFILIFITGLIVGTVLGLAIQSEPPEQAQNPPPEQPQERPEPPPPLEIGTVAPDFTLKDIDGKTYSLSDYKGKKPVLVELFATWCPHCQHTTFHVSMLKKELGNRLQVLAIKTGDRPGEPPAEEFRNHFKVTSPILVNTPDKVADDYHLYSFPTFYLVDKEGIIRWHHLGGLDIHTYEELTEKIKSL